MPVVKMNFVDLTNLESLEMDLNPDAITDSRTPDISSTNIPGASHPRVNVGSGGPRVIQFTLRIARLNLLDSESIVKDQIAWLHSVTTPYVNESFDQHFWTPLQFRWGSLYDLPVLLRSVSANMQFFRGIDALPEWADVDLQLEELAPETVSSPDVRVQDKGFVRFIQ